MRRAKVKCQKCNGSGVTACRNNRFGVKIYQDCQQCLGRGNWWPNNKPQQPRRRDGKR